jgi:hypothetical protein
MDKEKLLQSLDNYFIGIISFQLFVGITVYFLTRNGYKFEVEISRSAMNLSVIILTSTALALLKIVESKLRLSALDDSSKLAVFKKLSIFRLTLLTACGLVIIILYNLSAQNMFLLIYFLLFILLFAYRPIEKKFEKEFN